MKDSIRLLARATAEAVFQLTQSVYVVMGEIATSGLGAEAQSAKAAVRVRGHP
jgi:hypothetical protein